MKVVGDLLVEFKSKPRPGEEPPVLTLTEENGFVYQADRFNKRLATDDTSNYKVVKRGDIAFNPYLLWAGAVAQNSITDAGVMSPLYPTFRVREGYDSRYVARLLLTPQMIKAYDGIAFGSVPRRRRSSVKDFLALPLASVPSLDEQRRITTILDHADAIRTKRRQILTHLDTLTQAIFHDMFGGEDHKHVSAGKLMPWMRNGLSPATSGEHAAEVLTLSAITQGPFDPHATKPGMVSVTPPADKRVTSLDFMICRGNGNKDLVGVGVFSDEDRSDLVFPDTVIAGRVDPSQVTMPFLEVAWRQEEVRRQIEGVARTTNGTYKINQKSLSSVVVRVPPMSQQQDFTDRISRIGARRALVQMALRASDELFASLQSRAFRGEL